MTFRVFRRASAIIAAAVLVLAVAGPAFANVRDYGTFSCPSRPSGVHGVYQGNGILLGPGATVAYPYYDGAGWHARNQAGVIGGGDWYVDGQYNVDAVNSYPYCS